MKRRFFTPLVVLLTSFTVTAQTLTYQKVVAANPLKGFMPFAGMANSSTFPHSMEFFYIPLKVLMTGPSTFDWTALDNQLNAIAGRGHQAVFRVYLDYPNKDVGTPDFLIRGPDGVLGTEDDLLLRSYTDHANGMSKTSLSPDYTNTSLRDNLKTFIAALGARYDGDVRIGVIQVGLLGFWGEWHTFPQTSFFPGLAVQQEILGAFDAAFNRTFLMVRTPKDSSFKNYAMGYHDDSFAYETLTVGSKQNFHGQLATYGETERWKTQPLGGELRPELQPTLWSDPSVVPAGQGYDLCVDSLHPSMLLAGKAFRTLTTAARAVAEQQSQLLGYEFYVPTATLTASPTNRPVNVAVTLRNTGVAPFYSDWPLELAVINAAKESVYTVRPPSWSLTGQLPAVTPGTTDRVWTYSLPASTLPAGSYTLLLRVVNPLANGVPLRFANATQDAHLTGWLTLGGFTVRKATPSELR